MPFSGGLGYESQESFSRTGPVGYIDRLLRPVVQGQYQDLLRRGPFTGPLTPGYDPFQEQAYGAGGDLYGQQFAQAGEQLGGFGAEFGAGVPDAVRYYRESLGGARGYDPRDAAAFAFDPTLDATIGAAQRDIGRGFREEVLPGISRDYRGIGQSSGSTRRGIAEGLAGGRAAEAMGDVSTQLRGQSFARGQDFAASEVARRAAERAGSASALGRGAMDFYGAGLGFGERGVAGLSGLGGERRGIGGELMADQYRQFYEPMSFFERYMGTMLQPGFGSVTRGEQTGTSASLGFKP